MTLQEHYENLGNLSQQQKDDLLRGLLVCCMQAPIVQQADFREKWDKWRKKLDYYLSFTTFNNIMRMLIELQRLRYIQDHLVEIKEPLLKEGGAIIKIGSEEYDGTFLLSCLALLKDEDTEKC